MTEKVKVTQNQKDWLDRYELTQEQIDHYIDIQPHKKRPDSPVLDWSSSKLARALYIGYEVEPEFKHDDPVMVKWKGEDKEELWHVMKAWDSIVEIYDELGNFSTAGYNIVRHATESEIKQEKERRTHQKIKEFLSSLNEEEQEIVKGKYLMIGKLSMLDREG